jgi:ribosomal protein S27E
MQKVERVFTAPIVFSSRSFAECRACDHIATLFDHKKAVLSSRSFAECRACDYIATLFAHKKAVLSSRSFAECRACDYIATLFAHKKACKAASEGAYNPVEMKSLLEEK